MPGTHMAYRDYQHCHTTQVVMGPHHPSTMRSQKQQQHNVNNVSRPPQYGSQPQLQGSNPPIHRSAQINGGGSHQPSLSGFTQSASHQQVIIAHPLMNGGHPYIKGGHPHMNWSHPQMNGSLPLVNGQARPVMNRGHLEESDQNRAAREAFRKERKLESYLAEDLNFPTFAKNLKEKNLQLRDIPADGNCLFRALGDQLEGHCRNHYRHRQEVVQFMLDHRKDFEPFVEDDVPFDDHLAKLKRLGTHAGNDALVAFARLHNVNVFIHQLQGDPLQISGPSSSANVRQIHIAYHNGDHYSSIRHDGDNTESPANIRIQDASVTVPPLACQPATEDAGRGVVTAKRDLRHLEAEVIRATGCQDFAAVRASLKSNAYDVDATIASLMHTLDLGGTQVADDTTSLESHQTTDSGIWTANGSAPHIMGGGSFGTSSMKTKGQKVHFREDSYGSSSGYSSMGSNRGGGTRPKLFIPQAPVQCVVTGRTAKERKKMQKLKYL